MRRAVSVLAISALATLASPAFAQHPKSPRPEMKVLGPKVPALSAEELGQKYRDKELTAEKAVKAYLKRIKAHDDDLQSIISLNPNAVAEAKALDKEAKAGKFRGPLHGIPVLVKDNIETKELPTTAGSLALVDNDTGRDAPIIARLRAEGAIILGKTNLSEWANFRSYGSISGWSGVGGQTRNPHSMDRSSCGSSSGSGAAVAALLAPLAIGTETNGSVMCPSAMNGIVGFKPTVGVLEQDLIVPISSTQDTAGPMTRSVRDAAIMMDVMTSETDADYVGALGTSIEGMRIGVLRFAEGDIPAVSQAFEDALTVLEGQGAILVQIDEFDQPDGFWTDALNVLLYEFKSTVNEYLENAAPAVSVRTLASLIDYNESVADRELALFDQSILVAAQEKGALTDTEYLEARETIRKATQDDGIDKLLAENNVEVLVMPSRPPAFLIDAVYGDTYPGGSVGAGWMAAIAGYPIATIPMGEVKGLPIGLGVMGAGGEDAKVLSVSYQYEQASKAITLPSLAQNAFEVPATAKAMRPAAK